MSIFKKKASELTIGEGILAAIIYLLAITPLSIIITMVSMVINSKLEFMDWDDILDSVVKFFQRIGKKISEFFTKD